MQDTEESGGQFQPLFSLEFNGGHMKTVQMSDKHNLSLCLPFQAYYFNQSLNFFEPLVEKTQILVGIDSNAQGKAVKVEIKDLLNINFSVALYDTIFNLMGNLKQEQLIYEQNKQA